MSFKAFILLFLLWIQLCYSQEAASVWYDTDNGLPKNSVKDIIKDKYGFIWLSTESGLVRHDGNNFVTYNHFKLKNKRFSAFFGNIEKDSIYDFTAYTETIVLLSKRNVSTVNHQNNCTKTALHEIKLYGLFVENGTQEKTDHKDVFIYFDKKIVHIKELEEIIAIRSRKLSKTFSKHEYTKEQFRKESLRQKKILETICHDIITITPIKLSITAQKLYETDEHDHCIQKKYFESFYTSSVDFYNFMKPLKEYAEIYNIYEVIKAKKAFSKVTAKEQNPLIINNIKDPTRTKNNQNVIAVTIHNLIDNVVKNTTNGIIELSTIEDSRNFF
ncbi:hypothetical protein [Chryseobacterium sp. RU33C]|uniref:hypothetical protein n=1 Tax=Chryseobacterium sp. RU33C TaxID=1907398 RepID=UPI000956728E|nr:hypothetical protein [Chryseobacterium sp. RU33C]SIR70927.1 hypothetical protein SAMN05880573_13628 [Chryseobacterium sp. RU33C]